MAAARRTQLDVGEIAKPHGLAGAVVVRLYTDQVERLAVGSTLDTDAGELRVRSARPLKDRFVVAFDGVSTIDAAERLRGIVLRAAPIEVPGVLWVDELIGARVLTEDGTAVGVVEAVESNPASDLLVLDTGVLVPTRFVRGDLVDGTVVVELPEGLLEEPT